MKITASKTCCLVDNEVIKYKCRCNHLKAMSMNCMKKKNLRSGNVSGPEMTRAGSFLGLDNRVTCILEILDYQKAYQTP